MTDEEDWKKRNRRYSSAGSRGAKAIRRMREARAKLAAARDVAEASQKPDSVSDESASR